MKISDYLRFSFKDKQFIRQQLETYKNQKTFHQKESIYGNSSLWRKKQKKENSGEIRMFNFSKENQQTEYEDMKYEDVLEFYEKRTGVAIDFMKIRFS